MREVCLYGIYSLVELIKILFVYHGLLNIKFTEKQKRYLYAICVVLGNVILTRYVFQMQYTVIPIICDFIVVCLIVQCDWKTKLITYIIVFMGIDFVDMTIATISGWLFHFNPLDLVDGNATINSLFLVLPSFMLTLIIFLCNRKKAKYSQVNADVSLLQYLLIIAGLICSEMLMAIVSYLSFAGDMQMIYKARRWITILAIISVGVLILLIVYIQALIRIRTVQNELLARNEWQNNMQKEYYQELYAKGEDLKRERHDFRHHLHYIREMLQSENNEEAERYIQKLEGKIANEKLNIVYSGNAAIDAVICGVLGSRDMADIEFDYQGKMKKQIEIEDVDICTLLANALENAVEACERCVGRKYIQLAVAMYKSSLFITICNSCMSSEKGILQELKTQKENKEYHGYGIMNMKAVVEKYNGSLQLVEKEGEFVTKIRLDEKINKAEMYSEQK